MGGCDSDLNEIELSDGHTQLTVFSPVGGSDIHLPDTLNVEVSDFAFMGGNEVSLGDATPDPGGPVLRIRLISIMGRPSGRGRRKKRRRLHG